MTDSDIVSFLNSFVSSWYFLAFYTLFGGKIGVEYMKMNKSYNPIHSSPIFLLCGPIFWVLYGIRLVMIFIEILLNLLSAI